MSDESVRPELPRPSGSAEQDDWLARVDRIAPLLVANRDRAEHDRVTPRVVFEALRDTGLSRMWVSQEFGGEQVGIETGMAVLQVLARIDAAVAWQIGVQGAIGHLSDYLPEDSARELFKKNTGLVIGGVKPFGRAEIVPGGYVLTGEWSFASGIAHAGWLASMAFVTEHGKPVMTPDGPDIRVLFIPPNEVDVLDTWHTTGLRGSGSNHYRVEDLFVPETLTVGKSAMQQAPPARPSRGYGLSYFDFGPFTTAPVALGVAQEALGAFKELAGGKVPASGQTTLAASHTVQEKLARAEMRVYSSDRLLCDVARLANEHGVSGDDGLSALIRLTGATVGENSVAAVGSVYELAGSSSVYTSSRLDRCFRDVHAATKHIALSASHFEMVGQYLLGGALQMRR
jgi:indole-3-acetate monooxygenase